MTTERIKELFDRAVALSAAERATFLAQQCDGDQALRQEVESLLAFDPSPAFLDAPVVGKLAEFAVPSAPVIRGYELLERIGTGGMGTVWRAIRRHDGFALTVAVKVLHRGTESEAVVRRFERERRILAELDHPGIARLLDGGTADDGRPYLVMEFVAGVTIDRHCRGLPLRERLELFARVCDAVAAAHGHGVVHRDLKPANVLVRPDGSLRLLDFGIAKLLQDDEDGALTQTGDRLLTPRYAAPEQFVGGRVGPFTDVWALGVMLHEAATGRPLFAAEATVHEIETSVRSGALVPPSRCVARALRRELHGDVDVIVLRALAVDPDRRYPSAQALADDLRRFLAHEPIAARRDTVGYRLARFARRHRAPVAGALVAILALSIGLGLALRAYSQADHERREAEFAAAVAAVAAAQGALQRGDAPTARQHLERVPEAMREFEWRHLAARLEPGTFVLAVNDAASPAPYRPYDITTQVRFHPDGRRLLAVGDAGMRVWDYHTRQLLASAPGPKECGFRKLVFATDGATFCWIPEFGRGFEQWSVEPLQRVAVHPLPSTPLAIAADGGGTRCAIGLGSGELVVVDLRTRSQIAHFSAEAEIRSVIFSPDGVALYFACGAELRCVDLASGMTRTICEFPQQARRALVHHPHRSLVAVGLDSLVWLVDPTTGRTAATLPGAAMDLAFSPDGEELAMALGYDGMRVVRWRDGSIQRQAPAPARNVACVSFDPAGGWLVTTARDQLVRLYDLDEAPPLTSQKVHTRGAAFAAVDPGGRWLVSHAGDKVLRVFSARRLEPVAASVSLRLNALDCDREGNLVCASAERDADGWSLRVLELPSLQQRARVPVPAEPVRVVATADAVFVGLEPNHLLRLHWPSGRVAWSRESPPGVFALSRDGRLLAVRVGQEVQLLDASSGAPLRRYGDELIRRARAVTFLDGDTRIVVADLEGGLVAFDVATGRRVASRAAHGHGIQDVTLSPDGRRLLTAGRDGLVRLWDPQRLEEVFSERVSNNWTHARFDREGNVLFGTAAGELGRLAVAPGPVPPADRALGAADRQWVDRLAAELEAAHGDDTAAALADLAARPALPEAVRWGTECRVRCLPGESRWLLDRAWRTALDPAATKDELHRADAFLYSATDADRATHRVHKGMVDLRLGTTRSAVIALSGGDFSGLAPHLQQARLAFLALTLAARNKPRSLRRTQEELRECIAAHGRLLPEHWLALAETAVPKAKR